MYDFSCSVYSVDCMMCVLVDCCFFFFFKQKTAYEMRISDWSSDVCSSDLPHVGLLHPDFHALHVGNRLDRLLRRVKAARTAVIEGKADESLALQRQIGRASCRERVCQSV